MQLVRNALAGLMLAVCCATASAQSGGDPVDAKLREDASNCFASDRVGPALGQCVLDAVQRHVKALEAVTPPTNVQPDEFGLHTWHVIEDVSRMTGAPTVMMFKKSRDTYRSRSDDHRATWFVRCKENKTDVFFSFDGLFFASHSAAPVIYRFDLGQPISTQWSASTDNTAIGPWAGPMALAFIKQAATAKRVIVRPTTWRDGTREVEFMIDDLATALVPLRAACKW